MSGLSFHVQNLHSVVSVLLASFVRVMSVSESVPGMACSLKGSPLRKLLSGLSPGHALHRFLSYFRGCGRNVIPFAVHAGRIALFSCFPGFSVAVVYGVFFTTLYASEPEESQ